MSRILGTLVYCLRGDEVLMMLRRKAPNLGLWVAPGGKVEADEAPYECARRVLREEAGYEARSLRFRGLIAETSPRPDWQWLLFIFAVTEFTGELIDDGREGALRWWPRGALACLPVPPADAIFNPIVIDLAQPFYQARYVYDHELCLTDVMVYPNGDGTHDTGIG